MKTVVILLGISLAATAAWAGEGEGERRGPPKFEEMDANGDGSVSLGEFTEAQQKQIERRFRFLDSNNDGKLSQGEIESGRERMKQRYRERE